jgi:hypothetical protein
MLFLILFYGHISFVFYKHWMEWGYGDVRQQRGKEEKIEDKKNLKSY